MIIDASDRFDRERNGKTAGASKAIEQVGAQAFEALFGDMHSKIDPVSRQIFAANFGKLLKQYDLFYPRHFERVCEDVASSYASFRTTFGSMKNPASKNIPSGKIYWKNYCQLLIKRLKKKRITLSEEYVAHRLTVGTQYHPTAKSPNAADQVASSYQTLAMEIDTRFGLLDKYREISNIIVDRTIEDVRRKMATTGEYVFLPDGNIIHSELSKYFNEEYLAQRQFSASHFIDLTRDELSEIINELTTITDSLKEFDSDTDEGKERMYFFYARQEIERYMDATDYRSCHVPEPIWGEDFRHHAHCLIGVYIHEKGSWEAKAKDFLEKNCTEQGWTDPVFDEFVSCDDSDELYLGYGVYYAYLVLFPDGSLTNIRTYIVIDEEEGTHMALLDEDVIAYRGNHFINTTFPHGAGSENNNLIDLLSDAERIIRRLKETAPNLNSHPLLVEKNKEKQDFQNVVNILCNPFDDD